MTHDFDAKRIIETLTEDQAMKLFWEMQNRFGWSGTVFTRYDAEQEWQNLQFDPATGLTSDASLPEDTWEEIQNDWYWSRGIPDLLVERGWEMVSMAVDSAMEKKK